MAAAAELIADHAQRREALAILGGGTRPGLGNVVMAEAALTSTGLSGILSYDPREMVMTALAGTPLAVVEAALAEAGQMLAFEPVDFRPVMRSSGEPTIGGVFAANISGPRRLIAGAARDSLLGLAFINGRGETIHAGGRVMKNVTGLDLVKLLCGSQGTLGFMAELTFRVPPRPKTQATLLLTGLDDERASLAMARAMAMPLDVSAAAHLPITTAWCFLAGKIAGAPATVLRIEGSAHSVEERMRRLAEGFSGDADLLCLDEPESRQLWREIGEMRPFADPTDRPVWRISVPPSQGHRLVAGLRLQAGVDAFYDWQGGLVILRMEAEPDDRLIRHFIQAAGGGHATLLRAAAGARASVPGFEPQPPVIAALSQRLKAAFDPAGILNPGKMGA